MPTISEVNDEGKRPIQNKGQGEASRLESEREHAEGKGKTLRGKGGKKAKPESAKRETQKGEGPRKEPKKRGQEMTTNAPLMKSKGSLERVCRQNVTVRQCAAPHCPLINAAAVLGVLPRAVLAEPWSASALEAKVVAVKNQRTLCDPRMQLSRCSSITRSLCSAPSWLDRAAVCCSALSAARFFRGPRRAAPHRPGWTVLQCAAVCCSALSAARFSAVPGWTVCCLHNP